MSKHSSSSDERFFFSSSSGSKSSHDDSMNSLRVSYNDPQVNHYSSCSNSSKFMKACDQLSQFTDLTSNYSHPQMSTASSTNYTPLGLLRSEVKPTQWSNESSFSVIKENWNGKEVEEESKPKMIVVSSTSSSSSSIPQHNAGQNLNNNCIPQKTIIHNLGEFTDIEWNDYTEKDNCKPRSVNKNNCTMFGKTLAKDFSSNTNRQELCLGKTANVLSDWVNVQQQASNGTVSIKMQNIPANEIENSAFCQQLQQAATCQDDYKQAFQSSAKRDKLLSTISAKARNSKNLVVLQSSQVKSHQYYDEVFEEQLEVVHMKKTKSDQAFSNAITSMGNLVNLHQARIKKIEQELKEKDEELASEKEKNIKLERVIQRQKGLFRSINSLVAVPLRFLTKSLSEIMKEKVLEEPILNLTAIGKMTAQGADWQQGQQ